MYIHIYIYVYREREREVRGICSCGGGSSSLGLWAVAPMDVVACLADGPAHVECSCPLGRPFLKSVLGFRVQGLGPWPMRMAPATDVCCGSWHS